MYALSDELADGLKKEYIVDRKYLGVILLF